MRGDRQYYVYMLASRQNGTLYTGMTNDIVRRVHEHRTGTVPGFSRKYETTRLVWCEVHPTLDSAYQREKHIKGWKRSWKIQLIEHDNPDWRDLTHTLM